MVSLQQRSMPVRSLSSVLLHSLFEHALPISNLRCLCFLLRIERYERSEASEDCIPEKPKTVFFLQRARVVLPDSILMLSYHPSGEAAGVSPSLI